MEKGTLTLIETFNGEQTKTVNISGYKYLIANLCWHDGVIASIILDGIEENVSHRMSGFVDSVNNLVNTVIRRNANDDISVYIMINTGDLPTNGIYTRLYGVR